MQKELLCSRSGLENPRHQAIAVHRYQQLEKQHCYREAFAGLIRRKCLSEDK